jgi:hypothetical protein
MRLTFGSNVVNQGSNVEPPGVPKDRAGDIDRIVKGKLIDDFDRGIVDASQPLGELGASRDFNLAGQPSDHLSEGPNLIFGVRAGDQ